MSEIETIINYFLIGGSWGIILIIVIYYIAKNPDKMQKWGAIISKSCSFASKKIEKYYISRNIQSTINIYRKDVNKECEDLIPFKTEIKFKSPANLKKDYVEHKGNKLIVVMKNYKSQDENLMKAVNLSTQNTLIPYSRKYIDPKLMRSIDLQFIKNLIYNNDRSKLNYFIDTCMAPELYNNNEMKKNIRILEALSEKGVFIRILLKELKDYGSYFYPKVPNRTYYKEPKQFLKMLKELANKEQNIDINPNYIGDFIKVSIVMIGRPQKLFTERGMDISPYLNYIFLCEEKGTKVIYLLAWSINVVATEKIKKFLNVSPDRFKKMSESNYNVKIGNREVNAICIRYSVLKNI